MKRLKEELKSIDATSLNPDIIKAKKSLENIKNETEEKMLKAGKLKTDLENKYLYV